MFLAFLAFCMFTNVEIGKVEVPTVLMFMEYLSQNGLSPSSIRSYMAGIIVYFKWFNLRHEVFYHFKVTLMYRALQRSIHRAPKFKGVFTVTHLQEIIKCCGSLPNPHFYRTAYLFAYFGFLRISNLVPSSRNTFSIKKHLCRGDVLINNDSLVVLIKWSKTLQASNQGSYIILPKFNESHISPWHHFVHMSKMFPVCKNQPCFSYRCSFLVESMLREHLRKIVASMGLDPSNHTFHTFRRSGTTLAHNLDIPIKNIKRHGTWMSDAVQSYIIDDPQRASAVSTSFVRFFNQH